MRKARRGQAVRKPRVSDIAAEGKPWGRGTRRRRCRRWGIWRQRRRTVGWREVDWKGPGLGAVDSEAGGSEAGDLEVGSLEAEAVVMGTKSRPGCHLPGSRSQRGRRPGKRLEELERAASARPLGESAAGGAKGRVVDSR